MRTLLLAAVLLPQEVDNPEYGFWSACKKGSWVRVKMTIEQDGKKHEVEQTSTLVELTPGKAVVEQSGKTAEGKMPTQKRTIAAKQARPDPVEKEGEEDVEVGGKRLPCRWIELRKEEQGARVWAKIWTSPEVPGGVVKSEIKPEGKGVGTIRVLVEAWEKK